VRADIAAFDGLRGGYIGRGEVAGDVPLENTEAMLDEITGHRDTDSQRTPGETQ
jgi:hypothetical protein